VYVLVSKLLVVARKQSRGQQTSRSSSEQPAHVRAVSSAHERRVEFDNPSELHSTAAQPSATQHHNNKEVRALMSLTA
jgi:hypothetical protein